MSSNVIQTSFSSGELAPSIFAHTDLAKYKSGAALMRNFFVDYRSGASTRPGTKFIAQAKISNKPVRLIPFQFSSSVGYVIEFGDRYCRFINDGGMVLETAVNITGATNALPIAISAPGNTFALGDTVFVAGMEGMPQANNRFYIIASTGATVTLNDQNGQPVSSQTYGTYTSGGTISKVYEIVSPYAAEDLALLKFVQSASVMTLTHQDYAPRTLTASAPTSWAFAAITFGSSLSAPTGLSSSATAGSGAYFSYAVTAVDTSGQESQMTKLAVDNVVNLTTTAGTITISWSAVTGAARYNVYRAQLSIAGAVPTGQAYGFLGDSTGTSFIDSNISPDFSITPPISNNPFSAQNPIAFCYFQQRASYGGSSSNPTDFWMSQPGAFNNFDYSIPSQEDDSIEETIVSLELNAIKWMVPMPGGLVIGTSKGAWQVNGGTQGAGGTTPVTPLNITATPQAFNGASDVQPLVVNYDILFVQAKGSIVRDLNYNIYANIYSGMDVSVLSNHLFLNYQITEWTYAEEPFKVIWAVRNDGTLLTLTFVKEQEIAGWAHSDTQGLFKSVASITEGQVDAVYIVAQRRIGGRWVKMIERFDDRMFTYSNANPDNLEYLPIPMIRANAESSWCVDCGAQSTLEERDAELTADTFTGDVTFEADTGVFTSDDVDSVIRMGGGRATITSFVSSMQVLGEWTASPSEVIFDDTGEQIPVPQASGNWSIAAPFTTFYGLDHLEGETVSILADGGVVTQQVVSGGSITLANEATLVTVGLGFTAQLKTMPLDLGGAETVQGKRKNISALNLKVVNTRGLSAGSTFATLSPLKELFPAIVLGEPVPLVTGDERIVMDANYNVPGQICLQQSNPLPATILGVIPEIEVGDD